MHEFLTGTAVALALIAITTATGAGAQETAAADNVLPDIIVTAQKRPEVGQRAPLVVTSLDVDALEAAHIAGATDLQRVVPNLTAQVGGGAGDPGGGNTLFTIRGLGASATGPQGSAGVAAHFDGVYRQDGISNSEFYDLERIEVSPGPQGTLYGRSAAAGAINILPARPVMKTEAAASISYGNYDSLTTQGMLNLATNDGKLAVRAAFQTQDHDGYYSNGYDALDAVSGRLQVLIKPDDNLSIRLATNFTQLRGRGAGNIFVGGPSLPLLAALLPQSTDPDLRQRSVAQFCLVKGQLFDTCIQDIRINKFSALAEIAYDFGGAVLTLLPAFNKSDRSSTNANAPLPLSTYNQQPYDNEQLNLEGRLSDGGDGKLKWVVGGNFYRNTVETFVDQFINVLIPQPIPLPTPPFPPGTRVNATASSNAFQDQRSQVESWAVFGQATYPVVDTVRLTLGGRYNHDKSSGTQVLGNVSNVIYAVNGAGPLNGTPLVNLLPTPITTPPQSGSQSFNAFTYRVAVDADIGPRSIVYGSIGSGYKPGGLNDGGPISSTAPASPLSPEQFFGPEKVTHFELGTKNRFLNGSLQLNAALYYDDYNSYQNGQTQVVNPLQFGALGFVVTNAGKARVYGAEVALTWQASANDIFDVSANYLNAKFKTYSAPAYLGPNGPTPAANFDGFALPNAPEFSGNISYRHTFELGNRGALVASVFSHLSSGYWVYFAQSPGTYQDAYTSTTLDLTWTSADERFRVSAFVNNLEDNDVRVFGGSTAGYSQVGLAAPRTYGGTIAVKF